MAARGNAAEAEDAVPKTLRGLSLPLLSWQVRLQEVTRDQIVASGQGISSPAIENKYIEATLRYAGNYA